MGVSFFSGNNITSYKGLKHHHTLWSVREEFVSTSVYVTNSSYLLEGHRCYELYSQRASFDAINELRERLVFFVQCVITKISQVICMQYRTDRCYSLWISIYADNCFCCEYNLDLCTQSYSWLKWIQLLQKRDIKLIVKFIFFILVNKTTNMEHI